MKSASMKTGHRHKRFKCLDMLLRDHKFPFDVDNVNPNYP